ncbi:conserved oligomeric Golgi complex subunit 7-like [Glandiceps talaboti]
MLDFSKFLDDSFDVKDWVNSAFKAQRDSPQQKDALASTLVMKLQLFIQEVNNSIEETSQQALQNLPRVLRDIEAVKQEATLLQEQMQMVKEDIKKVEQDTAQSMQMLLELDAIKSKMQAASTALKEADNWTTLMSDIDDLFLSQDVQAISKKLLAMQHSLSLLAHCGDYEERSQYLETLKNRLETLISPQLIKAFNDHSLESAKEYVTIFSAINRLPQLYNYYYRCHKATLLQHWRKQYESNHEQPLVDWLPTFYDHLTSTWHTEVGWCQQIFDDPVKVVCDMLSQTLVGLEPPLPAVLAESMQESPLLVLIDVRQITLRFSRNIQGALQGVIDGENYDSYVYDLVNAIHLPYTTYLLQYGELEQQHLLNLLNDIPLDRDELIDSAEILAESVTKVFNLVEEAVDRCMTLTEGCGSMGLIRAIKALFGSYCFEFNRVLTNLRAKAGLDSPLPSSASSEITEDWEQFQHALRIIQTCGDILLQIENIEGQLCNEIVKHAGKFLTEAYSPRSITTMSDSLLEHNTNPFKYYNYLIKSDPIQYAEFAELLTLIKEESQANILKDVINQVEQVNEETHKFAFDIVFYPLKVHLGDLSTFEVWSAEASGAAITTDLPAFSMSPMEYITKIGQYLMTLPQQLESFTTQDNTALEKALQNGKLPFPDAQGAHEEETVVDQWIGAIARATMHQYVEQIVMISQLTVQGTKQLTTDIDYLCNVLDALGIPGSSSLTSVESLLKTPLSQFDELDGNIDQRLIDAVLSMRSE